MKGRFLIIVAVIAAIFAAEFVLRTDTANANTLISPSATPRKRTETVNNNETITISGRKPKTGTAAHRTSVSTPAKVNPRKPRNPRNQDIEVENDETHLVGHNRKKGAGSVNRPTQSQPKLKKPRRRR